MKSVGQPTDTRHKRLRETHPPASIYDGQVTDIVPSDAVLPDTVQITRVLAQRLVEQVAPSLVHNVNIMDAAGLIIGSLDASRIGTLHDGARNAAGRGETVQIAPGDEQQGTRPGVNIPLILDGRVVAVVGVTGTPAEVLPVAQVLVLTVQMLIMQERLRDNASWRESATRDILSSLSLRKLTEGRLIAALQGIDAPLQPPWNLTGILHLGASRSVLLLRQLRDVSGVVAADIYGAVWVLSGSSTALSLALLQQRLQQPGSKSLRFLTGRVGATMVQLTDDAERLSALLAWPGLIGTSAGEPCSEIPLDSLGLELAIAVLPDELLGDVAGSVLDPLGEVLRETARVFLREELSIAHTAAALGVHRNTVVQRLDRIELLTDLNIRRFSCAVSMRVALAANSAQYVHDAQV